MCVCAYFYLIPFLFADHQPAKPTPPHPLLKWNNLVLRIIEETIEDEQENGAKPA